MARLPALITALESLDLRGRASVENVARYVREAGLITTTGRGAGAAEMTPRDAANLLIALKGAPLFVGLRGDASSRAPTAVIEFSSLVRHQERSDDPRPWAKAVFEAETLGAAIEAAIDGADYFLADWSRAALARDPKADPEQNRRQALNIGRLDVLLARPLVARIDHQVLSDRGWERVAYAEFIQDGRHTYTDTPGDDQVALTFTFRNLLALHEALYGSYLAGGSRLDGPAAGPACEDEGNVETTPPGGAHRVGAS